RSIHDGQAVQPRWPSESDPQKGRPEEKTGRSHKDDKIPRQVVVLRLRPLHRSGSSASPRPEVRTAYSPRSGRSLPNAAESYELQARAAAPASRHQHSGIQEMKETGFSSCVIIPCLPQWKLLTAEWHCSENQLLLRDLGQSG